MQEFSVPGTYTWTKPAGFQYAVVEVRGADGGAGSCRSGQNMCGGTTTCTGTGFDFFSTTPGLIPLNGNGFMPITTSTVNNSNSSCGGSSWTQTLMYGGKGSNGYVLVTPYVCQ